MYTETDCTITFQGKTFTSGGGAIVGDRALLYAYPAEKMVGNWHGTLKVPAKFGRQWRSNMGDLRQRVTFTWDTHRYTGIYYKSGSDIVRAKILKQGV
mgnify:CR=1 FL=1